MSKKYTASKRCYLIDHHSPQPPDVLLNQLNISEYESFFETANIDSLMVYCKDHWGVTYYPSKVSGSQQHNGMQKDWILEISTLLKQMDIEFVAYYCIEYDEGAARQNPQWRARCADGSALIRNDEFAKWSVCCYQSGYRQYCLLQLEEIVQSYKPDSLFLDIFGASLCYCDNCKKDFLSKFGYSLPETETELLTHKADVTTFLNDNCREFLEELKVRVKSIDPTLAVTINFSCHYPKQLRDMLDYQFSEPLLADNWFSSAYARDTAHGQYPILVPGEASQVYNYSPISEYMCDLSSIAAQGCRVGMYSGSQHIDGTLDHEEARRLGVVFEELKKMEPYLVNRTPVKCVGIIQSDSSMSMNVSDFHPDAILRMKRHNPHQNAVLGAMQLCEHAKLPFMILPEQTLSDELLAGFNLILLPEVYVIGDTAASLLANYVEQGGILISSGQSGMWNADSSLHNPPSVASLFGIKQVSIHTEYESNRWAAYLKNPGNTCFTGLLSCTTPPVSEHFIEATVCEDSETLLHFILPCVICDETHWVNWWSPPPGNATSFPALISRKHGVGTAYYMAFDFFTMASSDSFEYPHELFTDLIEKEQIRALVKNTISTPDIVRTAYFETENSYIIHQISMLPKRFHGDVHAVKSGILSFQTPVKNAKLVYPQHQELDVQTRDNETTVILPAFTLQQMIVCEKDKIEEISNE